MTISAIVRREFSSNINIIYILKKNMLTGEGKYVNWERNIQ